MKSQIVAAYIPRRGCQADLAFRFGVSRQYVHQALREAGVDTSLPKRQKVSKPRRRLTDEQRAKLVLFKGAQARARTKGLPFLIELGDITIPAVCPVLGIPLFASRGRWTANSPTIDRINNTKGYERKNIVVVSYRANQLKADATLEELRALARFYG